MQHGFPHPHQANARELRVIEVSARLPNGACKTRRAALAGRDTPRGDLLSMSDRIPFPLTRVVRRAIADDSRSAADLLFLESWERAPQAEVGTVLRVAQIRRANPELAAELRAELANAAHSRH